MNLVSAKPVALIFSIVTAFASICHAETIVKDADELRMALMNGDTEIKIIPSRNIKIDETLIYASTDPLTIFGNNSKITTNEGIDILEITHGADLTVKDLKIIGPGGYSIENQGEGIGILLNVPGDTGNTKDTVMLDLDNVTVMGNAEFGVLVQDCTADPCGSGGGGAGDGSDAGVHVNFHNVKIINNGNGAFDGDGARVNEREMGDIKFTATHTVFINNGADGLELDEGDEGDIYSHISYTKFNRNGNYCDPSLITLPDPDEAEDLPQCGAGAVFLEDLLAFKTNALDPMCVEIESKSHDMLCEGKTTVEEYETGIDLDDGVDFDEAGKGGIISKVSHSEIKNNKDEGADFDEEDDGGVKADFYYVNASLNSDDGIKVSEEGADTSDMSGTVTGELIAVTVNSNGGKAIVYEEAGAGDLTVDIFNSMTNGKNDDGDTGVEVVEENDGECNITVSDSMIKEATPVELGEDCAP